jgi:hypothetical protein
MLPSLSTTTTARPPVTSATSTTLSGTTAAGVFDLQAAIDSCPAGGTVTIPAGTFHVDGLVTLKSGVSLKGAGVDQTILDHGAETGPYPCLYGSGIAGVTISDLTITSPAPSANVFAIWISTYSKVTIARVKVTNCMYALKADTKGSDLIVRDFTVRNCGQNYISNLTGGTFTNLDIEVVTYKLDPTTFHALYLAANNHGLTFANVRAVGGSGWTIQLYHESTASDNIIFDGLNVSGNYPVVVADGFVNVTIRNLTAVALGDAPVIKVYAGATNVLVDTFTCSGGTQLVQSSSASAAFRNGTYQGAHLGAGATFENVVLR